MHALQYTPRRSAGECIALFMRMPLVSEDAKKSWVHIAKLGKWKGHRQGEFELTKEHFAQMIENFSRQTNSIPVYFEHPNHEGDGKEIPACGWIHELKAIGSNLYARCEWVDDTVPLLKKGKYRYCSMVFNTRSRDRVTDEDVGAELFELGLTNVPFIDGLEPIRLSARRRATRALSTWTRSTTRTAMNIDKKKLMEALEALPKDASAEQYHMALEAAVLAQQAMEKPEALEEEPKEDEAKASAPEADVAPVAASAVAAAQEPAPPSGEEVGGDELTSMLMQATGLSDLAAVLAFVKDNMDAIKSLAGKAPDEGTPAENTAMARLSARASSSEEKVVALSAQVKDLSEKLTKYELQSVEAKIDESIRCGHIAASHRDVFLKLGRLDATALDEELKRASSAPAVPTRKLVNSGAPRESASDVEPRDDIEKRIVKQLGGAKAKPETIQIALKTYRDQLGDELNGRA